MSEEKIDKRKQRIINAARTVFTEKGYGKATVREIAKEAGLTTGAIYHHYKNKEELLHEVINDNIHYVYKIAEQTEEATKAPSELLKEVQKETATRLSQIEDQKLHVLLLAEMLANGGELKEDYKKEYEYVIQEVADLFLHTFEIENKKYKQALSAIFVAALDGMAIQAALGLNTEHQNEIIEVFNQFFSESIPMYLNKNQDGNE